jgi:di/tricarboxylate transporter
MLPLGAALADSGAARLAADALVGALGGLGAWPVVGGFYLVTASLALFVPPAVLAVVMAPLLLSASTALGIAPQAPMMALAMACTSFASPYAHPANLLIMGPGGYRFRDYLRVGIPLTLLVFLTAMVVLPRLWPLAPGGGAGG